MTLGSRGGNWWEKGYSSRNRRISRADRLARRLLERWREAPVRAATVGPGRNPQRESSREVSSKLRRAPSWRAAARRTRRRRAGSRARRRSSSMEMLDWPGAVLTARPPPRTGLPGRRSWGRTRASSVCQRDSSSRASSARLARVWSRFGLKVRSWGRSSWRILLRVKAVSVLVESSRQGWLMELQEGFDVGAAGVEEGA